MPVGLKGLAQSPGMPGTPAPRTGTAAQASFQDVISQAAQATGLDPRLIRAVAERESGMDPQAVSSAGAQGLMQLMPGTARDLGVQNSFNPAENALGGARYLKEMLSQFGGNLSLALAAYNAGPDAVAKYGGIPPYPETEAYVRGVLQTYREALGAQSG